MQKSQINIVCIYHLHLITIVWACKNLLQLSQMWCFRGCNPVGCNWREHGSL